MRNIALLSPEERASLLRHNILKKCQGISSERLDFILSSINTKRKYFIKSTEDPTKFSNIMMGEYVATSSENKISTIVPLYGSYTIGQFFKTDNEKAIDKGMVLEKEPAAGVKISLVFKEGLFSKTYTLAIFEPR